MACQRSVVILAIVCNVLSINEASIFGGPSSCVHAKTKYACTFSFACWLIGGVSHAGCGEPSWLVSCCVTHRSKSIAPTFESPNFFRKRIDDYTRYRVEESSRSYMDVEPECGVTRESMYLQKRIIGGHEAKFGQFPWQALIRISAYQCGGVLLSKQYVATAAHCIVKAPVEEISVFLGELDTQNTGAVHEYAPSEKYRVSKKFIHPLFEYRISQPDRYDIALLKLRHSVKTYTSYILPICLPESDFDAYDDNFLYSSTKVGFNQFTYDNLIGKMAVVAGWGKIIPSIDQTGTNVLRAATVPIIGRNECTSWHITKKIKVELFAEMICAGHADGNQDACLGDSGGPLIVKINGKWTLIGIISAGFGCGEPLQPGIYHSVPVTVSWVKHIINL